MTDIVNALYPFFRAESWWTIEGRGDVAFTELDRNTMTFDHLVGEEVIISSPTEPDRSGLYLVHGVERFVHAAPWHRGEKIGLLVERV
jgi:hypothetical protein